MHNAEHLHRWEYKMGKTRDNRRKPKLPKPKPKIEPEDMTISVEGKTALAMAFAGIGGVSKLIEWAQTNTATMTAFFTLYGKTIPLMVGAQVNVNHNHDDENDQAKFLEGLNRIVETQRRMRDGEIERAIAVTIDNNGPDGTPLVTYHGGADASRAKDQLHAPTSQQPQQPQPDPPMSPKPKPVTPRIVHSSEPSSFVGACAGAALGEGSDDNLSTTERFLRWNGHGGRPP
jgi:hypothetical protein